MKQTRTKALRQLDEFAQAGLQCFLRGGFRLTQMADVADELGMSAGAIYRYVESKEALFDISVRYAAHLPINDIPIPVKVARLEDTIRVIREVAANWRDRPHLKRALTSRRPKDLKAEAEDVGVELFDRLSHKADFIGLLNRCSHDMPALLQIFNDEIKVPYITDITAWYQRRCGADLDRGGGYSAALARASLEAVSWLAMVRRRDATARTIDDDQARFAAASIFANMIAAGSRGKK